MRVHATAPGKLVLLGEYAVLEGAPALVLAVNRRAKVTLDTIGGQGCEIISPTLGISARLQLRKDKIIWAGTPPPELVWVALAMRNLPKLPACRILLDTDEFYHMRNGRRDKLGLGSSAALCVALLGALHAATGAALPTLADCMRLHREIQGGQGSGVDVAAAFTGGLLHFQLRAGSADCHPMSLPRALHWRCVYSGRAASTRALLATVGAWRMRVPDEYARRVAELATIGVRGTDAVARQDADSFISCCRDYAEHLAQLGAASGADIASHEHRSLSAIAQACGVVAKSCGAGGGDVGIALSLEDARLQDFTTRATAAGFAVVGLATDTHGLQTACNHSNTEV